MSRRVIEPGNGEEDWQKAREVLVRAFHNYSLYVHMEPDGKKRPEFLRRYLEANYDVTVRQGKGFLLIMRLIENENVGKEASTKIIGALIFVPAAEDGIAWDLQNDQAFWDAYEQQNLSEVSKECMERVKAYEAWEQENITEIIRKAKIPLWNGLFCALDPDYCPKGSGTLSYKKTVQMMYAQQREIEMRACRERKLSQTNHLNSKASSSKECLKSNKEADISSLMTGAGLLRGLTMLHHRPIPAPSHFGSVKKDPETFESHDSSSKKKDIEKNEYYGRIPIVQSLMPEQNKTENIKPSFKQFGDIEFACKYQALTTLPKLHNAPLIAAISHSSASAHFHEKNGFRKVGQVPYEFKEETSEEFLVPFNVHVLFMDPFDTGNIEVLANIFQSQQQSVEEHFNKQQGYRESAIPVF